MSTRCSIWIEQPDNTFKMYYHHNDGYISGVGEALYSTPKGRRTNLKTIVRGLKKRFGYDYVMADYDNPDLKHDYAYSRLETLTKEPFDIEWRYRILKDGKLLIESINTGEVFKIANRRHFDNLVHHTENDLE